MALWAFAAVTTAQDISGQLRRQRIGATIRTPIAATANALQAERCAAAGYLASPTAARAEELKQRAGETDRAAAPLRLGTTHTVADGTGLPDEVARRVRAFVGEVAGLRSLRLRITTRDATWDEAYGGYTKAVDGALAVGGALAATPQDRVLLDIGRSAELLAREDTLLSSAQLTHDLSGTRFREFTGAVAGRGLLLQASGHDLRGSQRVLWEQLSRSRTFADLGTIEDKVLAATPGRAAANATSSAAWEQASGPVLLQLRTAGSAATETNDPIAQGALTKSGTAVLLGFLAVLASLLISVRIGRGLVIELVELRNTALELANRKLPRAIRRLRAGEEIDLDAEVPRAEHGSDEIGQVGDALVTVQRAALQAAVERAELLSGVSGVFVNLARRSQVLVHRQLALLDSMERRTEDPGELEDLFRLDHLTTRMRRHAEGLIILSGAVPGRAWRRPVPLTNVVRAAVAEVEDYTRVEVRRLPQAAVIGSCVADLTHLVAELVENATQFSPPHTKVRVYGEQVGNGYALEVEDRGLGMSTELMGEANRRIGEAQALDLFDSDRLGLFVVSRLAKRHGVKVSLRPSPYGGTSAVVLLPTSLLDMEAPKADAARVVGARAATGGPTPAAARLTAATAAGVDELPVRQTAVRRNGFAGSASAPHDRAAIDAGSNSPRPLGDPALGHAALRDPAHRPPPPKEYVAESGRPVGPDPDAGELPRRVRRASLAPQLLDAPEPETGRAAHPGDTERSPEEARATMAAYRSGWVRGGGPQARDATSTRRPLRAAPHPAHDEAWPRDPQAADGPGTTDATPEAGGTPTLPREGGSE
jgi:signal transduction histidine kinase